MVASLRSIALLGLLAGGPAHAGPCAPQGLDQVPATPATVEVPPDGGLLVTSISTMSPSATDMESWRFSTKGKGPTKPVVLPIAPGLVRLAVAGTQLEDGAKQAMVTFTRGIVPAPLPVPPSVTSLTYTQGRRSTTVVAMLSAAPADGYLVVFDAEGKTARSWGRATSATVAVYAAGGCAAVADGTTPSRAGEKVRLAWVDMFGRMSPLTEPIEIASDPNPAPPY